MEKAEGPLLPRGQNGIKGQNGQNGRAASPSPRMEKLKNLEFPESLNNMWEKEKIRLIKKLKNMRKPNMNMKWKKGSLLDI